MKEVVPLFFGLLICSMVGCQKDHAGPTETDSPLDDLAILPRDSGGTQRAVYLISAVPYSYFIYIPSGYDTSSVAYPMLVFLHGSGSKGNSSVDTSTLNVVLRDGPSKLIYSKNWSPSSPMIVVSPQCHEDTGDVTKVHQLIRLITQHYRINLRRIYLTGFSMGGYGTYSYIDAYSEIRYVAAVAPICGGGNPLHASRFKNSPLWVFHGEADRTVQVINSINMVQAINAQNPTIPAQLTTYPGVDHDWWTRTYDSTGMDT